MTMGKGRGTLYGVIATTVLVGVLSTRANAQQFEEVRCVAPITEPDSDADGRVDRCDNCPNTPNGLNEANLTNVGNQTDSDEDGLGDACDPCPLDPNTNCEDAGDCGTQVMTFDAMVPAPIQIPDIDPAGIEDSIAIDGELLIDDIELLVQVNHTWAGDIIVTLEHNGTSVVVVDRPGLPGIEFGSAADGFNVVLDDEGTGGSIEDIPVDDTEPQVTSPPSFVPNEPLSAFVGQDLAGTWTLTVSDNQEFDTGMLVSWGLRVTHIGPDCPDNSNDNGSDNTNDNGTDNTNDNANDNGSDNTNDNGSMSAGVDLMSNIILSAEAVPPGQDVVITITAENLGNEIAPAATLSLVFDQFIEVVQATGTLTESTTTRLTWQPEALASGATTQQSVLVRVTDNAPTGDLHIQAIAGGSSADVNQTNNQAATTLLVQPLGSGNTNDNGSDNTNDNGTGNTNDNGSGNPDGQEMPPVPQPNPTEPDACGCGTGAAPMGMLILLGMALMRGRERRNGPA
jgi:subtilisin-like proprotein convertase family protein